MSDNKWDLIFEMFKEKNVSRPPYISREELESKISGGKVKKTITIRQEKTQLPVIIDKEFDRGDSIKPSTSLDGYETGNVKGPTTTTYNYNSGDYEVSVNFTGKKDDPARVFSKIEVKGQGGDSMIIHHDFDDKGRLVKTFYYRNNDGFRSDTEIGPDGKLKSYGGYLYHLTAMPSEFKQKSKEILLIQSPFLFYPPTRS